jgi:nicotinamide-nucleotide amidase
MPFPCEDIMAYEIISIGDELLLGSTLNTTSHTIARKLFEAGWTCQRITTVGDDTTDIQDVLIPAIKRAEFLILTGGLGPTTDDITSEAAAHAMGLPLTINGDVLRKLENHNGFSQKIKEKLASMPFGSVPLKPEGDASGYFLIHNQIPVFFLPGVPGQAISLLDEKIIPWLKTHLQPQAVYYRVMRTFGLPETEINRIVYTSSIPENVTIGYYPVFPEVLISMVYKSPRGIAEGQTQNIQGDLYKDQGLERAINFWQHIISLLDRHVICDGDETIEAIIGDLLLRKHATVATAESCTGGLIASRITSIPGSSQWFERGVITYSNQAKMDILKVRQETLEQFGAVSEQTAIQMVEGLRRLAKTDYALAVTGIAGPTGGSPEKPIGTVYIALATPQQTSCQRFLFSRPENNHRPLSRTSIQQLTAETALDWLRISLQYGAHIYSSRYTG